MVKIGNSYESGAFSREIESIERAKQKVCTSECRFRKVTMTNPITTQPRRAFAMLEVMIAVGLLTFAVAAITSAIFAGQQQSVEAKNTIVGAIAAESLLSQLSEEPWENLSTWHGYKDEVGSIADPNGVLIGGDWEAIGRTVIILDTELYVEELEIYIEGRNVTVSSFTIDGQTLSTVQRFVPEPQS